MFNQPGTSSGDKLDLKALMGALILVWPKEIKIGVQTAGLGPKDPLVADIAVLDGPQAGEQLRDAFIFPGVLIGQLKGYIGAPNPALGRVTLGEAKAGQNAPWMLANFTEADAATATAWLNANPRGFTQPAAAAAAPAVDHAAEAAAWALDQQRAAAAAAAAYAPPVTPPPAAAPPAAAAPPPGVDTATGEIAFDLATVKMLIGLGVPDADIANNTGATPAQIAAIRSLPAS